MRGRESALKLAESMLRELCQPAQSEEADAIKRQQLRELALLNGTYKSSGQTDHHRSPAGAASSRR
eukprot:2124616-Rhodomonas_salina.2